MNISIADLFMKSAARGSVKYKPCPFCGVEPALGARQINGVYIVGCESDDCHVNPQVSSKSLSEAWAIWDTRP